MQPTSTHPHQSPSLEALPSFESPPPYRPCSLFPNRSLDITRAAPSLPHGKTIPTKAFYWRRHRVGADIEATALLLLGEGGASSITEPGSTGIVAVDPVGIYLGL
jgi:hypothetical protein